ncbi:MAG: polysaccharide biosynthesis/export family protein [Burkholderiales bacterium]
MKHILRAVCAWFCVAGSATTEVGAAPVTESTGSDYRIGPEDVLEISVWREETLQKQALVRPDGGISFPLVGGVQAAGRTAEEIRQEIAVRLKKFIPDPVVSVSVVKLSGYKIYVLGKVNRPGEFVVGRYVDVLQALSMAGGLTPFADEGGIKVVRKVDGNDVVLPFNYAKVRKGRGLDQNIQLRSGDTLVVP